MRLWCCHSIYSREIYCAKRKSQKIIVSQRHVSFFSFFMTHSFEWFGFCLAAQPTPKTSRLCSQLCKTLFCVTQSTADHSFKFTTTCSPIPFPSTTYKINTIALTSFSSHCMFHFLFVVIFKLRLFIYIGWFFWKARRRKMKSRSVAIANQKRSCKHQCCQCQIPCCLLANTKSNCEQTTRFFKLFLFFFFWFFSKNFSQKKKNTNQQHTRLLNDLNTLITGFFVGFSSIWRNFTIYWISLRV